MSGCFACNSSLDSVWSTDVSPEDRNKMLLLYGMVLGISVGQGGRTIVDVKLCDDCAAKAACLIHVIRTAK